MSGLGKPLGEILHVVLDDQKKKVMLLITSRQHTAILMHPWMQTVFVALAKLGDEWSEHLPKTG